MNKKIMDPEAAREQEKYTNPIPSREYILSLLEERQAATREKISALLLLKTNDQQEALRRRLSAMRRDGQLLWSRSRGYQLTKHATLLKGTVIGHKEAFGFVTPDDGSSDLFLSAYQMQQVFPGDRVLIHVIGEARKGRREAAILEVLEHNTIRLVGYLEERNNQWVVKPIHPKIHHTISITLDEKTNAQPGKIVLIEIIQQPKLYHSPKGRIIKIIGDRMTPGIESVMAIHTYQIPYEWPSTVADETARLKQPLPLDTSIPRIDLRHLPFVTIDGDDSKDFDDAVYCALQKKEWRLLVAIADVSAYVKPHTAIDKEARLRGNSVYLPHQVVPMLPETLSNNVCSIKPNVDRLCLVCDMQISQHGKLKSYQFYPATICSKARLTYKNITDYLTNNNYLKTHKKLTVPIHHLKGVYQALSKAKQKRGAIDINLPESEILLDAKAKLVDIQRRERTIAHRIIEECMLAANVCAAQFLLKSKLPGLFRVHDAPSLDKLRDFQSLLSSLGINFKAGSNRKPRTADFALLMDTIQDHPDSQLIQSMLLRTMSQAVYSPRNKGHFGLAYPQYTHFTSPIRRYADLVVHRAIYYLLSAENKKPDYDISSLERLGQHCSITERRADEATRQAMSALKCQLMQTRLGESFIGRISHMTGFGFFVELKANLVEGLVHIHSLKDDHYLFDAKKMLFQGKTQGKSYRLGDTVQVTVNRINLDTNIIDFTLSDSQSSCAHA